MSKYHSICQECGFEDPNDGSLDDDCGHPFWEIVDHDFCDFCEQPWSTHSETEIISCERDLGYE